MRLSAPIRVTWDWHWPPVVHPQSPVQSLGQQDRLALAAELARAGVLMLEIGYPDPASLASGALEEVAGTVPAQISLVLAPRTVAALGGQRPWDALDLSEVWIDLSPMPGGQGRPLSPRECAAEERMGIRVYLAAGRCGEAVEIISEALARGARRVSLPIPPLFGSFLSSAESRFPTWRELVEFADQLAPMLARAHDLDLRVHNQALWVLLSERGYGPSSGEAPGHTGCQAAAALAYIDPAGVLYPCAALPLPLGRLADVDVRAVWRGEERGHLRGCIEKISESCASCRIWESCRGGCRGWAHFDGELEGSRTRLR